MLVLAANLFVARSIERTFSPEPLGDGNRIIAVFAIIVAGFICMSILTGTRRKGARLSTEPRMFIHKIELQTNTTPPAASLLPFPLPGFEIRRAYLPLREFRGDFFLTKPLRSAHNTVALVVLGDVSGKGPRSSVAVSKLVFAIDDIAEKCSGPADLLEKLNRKVHGCLNGEIATCIAAVVNTAGSCSFAVAGHPLPLLDGLEIPAEPGLPLGCGLNSRYAEQTITIDENSSLALYTNGLAEARDSAGTLFGYERLHKMFSNRLSVSEIAARVKEFGQTDDLTVLTLTRTSRVASVSAS